MSTTITSEKSNILSRLKQHAAHAKMRRGYFRIIAGRTTFRELLGTPKEDALAVTMCMWNRPGRITDILRNLDSMDTDRSLRLVIWNNQPKNDDLIVEAIQNYNATGALSSVELHTSPTNIGGFARFVAARELVRRGYTGSFIMIDDDQDFAPSFINDCLQVAGPRRIGGVWAFKNDGDYWRRWELTEPGEPATHTGNGGSICDSELVTHDEFFTKLPSKYHMIDDSWMCQCAVQNGWNLVNVASPFTFVLSEFDQGHTQQDLKSEYYHWLRTPGNVPIWNK